LKKAQKANLLLKPLNSKIASEFILNNLVSQSLLKKSVSPILKNFFKEVSLNFNPKFYGVFIENDLMAAGLFLQFNNRTYFFKGASNLQGKTIGATHFLIAQYLINYQNEIDIFDFVGGSSKGIESFYASFGASAEFYPVITKNKPSKLVTFTRQVSQYFNKVSY